MPFPLGIWEGLGGEAFLGRMQPFMLTLESVANSGPDSIVHTGHELVICLRRKLLYQVEDHQYLLNIGDSLLFMARLEHRWQNPGDGVTNAVIVLSGFEDIENPSILHYSSTG